MARIKIIRSKFSEDSSVLYVDWHLEESQYESEYNQYLESPVFYREDLSLIKWRLGFSPSTEVLYLTPESEENQKFTFKIRFGYRSTIGTTAGRTVSFKATTVENGRCTLYFPVIGITDSGRVAIVYPLGAFVTKEPTGVPVSRVMTDDIRSDFRDVSFKIEGQVIEAHKIILAERSDVFHRMFTSKVGDMEQKGSIIIKNASYDGFSQMLDIIYTGKKPSNPEVCLEILQIAHKYNMLDVENVVMPIIIATIKMNNAIKILTVSDTLGYQKIKEGVFDYIKKNPIYRMPNHKLLAKNPELMSEVLEVLTDTLISVWNKPRDPGPTGPLPKFQLQGGPERKTF